MGYSTDFEGKFKLNKALTDAHRLFIKQFGDTRRMKRDPKLAEKMSDPLRIAVGLPIGVEGGYFAGGQGMAGQDHDKSILEYNTPPKGQPGLWCQWVPSEDGKFIEWDGSEKFYYYVEWLEYIVKHFLKPWGYVLTGEVTWQGEESKDMGKITVKNNVVSTKRGRVSYE